MESAIESSDNTATMVTPRAKRKHRISSQLLASFALTLHTDFARRLFTGNWQHGRLGLVQFVKVTAIIWQAYKEDDPYAHWYLLKIYSAIEATKTELKDYERQIAAQIGGERGLAIELFYRPDPLQFTLALTPPFTFLIAQLLEQLDYVTRQLITLKRMCQVPPDTLNQHRLRVKAQEIFSLAQYWRYTGVTRADVAGHTQKAEQVKELFGEVPLPILKREVELPFFYRN